MQIIRDHHTCCYCGGPINPDELLVYFPSVGYFHADCYNNSFGLHRPVRFVEDII
jgi:hypothetical protein